MRKTLKIVTWIAGTLLVVTVALVGFVVVAANADWGRRLVETAAARISGGQVLITGISGHFPDDLRVASVEVRDGEGPWLIADDLTLQWSPSRLARKDVKVELVRAARVQLLRLPPASKSSGEPAQLQGRIDVDRLEVSRLEIGAPIAGVAATVALQGDAHVGSLTDAEATLTVTRIDGPGTYTLKGRIDASLLKAELSVDEPEHGLLSGLAGLPDLGALSIRLGIDGPRNAEATRFELAAGPLRASGKGLVDLVGRTVDLDVSASAPAMAPRPDVSWKSLALQAHVHGPFSGPDANGQLRVDALTAGDAQAKSVRADLNGNRGAVNLRAAVERLRVPGPRPALFESAPVELRADVRLDDPARPVTFALAHPLLSLEGHASTAGEIRGAATVTAPALAPFAAIAGVDLKGRSTFDVQVVMRDRVADIELSGIVGVTGGEAPIPALFGNARVELVATLDGDELAVKRAQVDGKTLRLSASGRSARDKLDVEWKLALSDLAALSSSVSGRLEAQGRAQGARDNLELTADASGDVGTERFPHGPVKASVRLRGLPRSVSGKVDASGTVDGSPLQVALAFDRARDGALRSTIERADWKSAHAEGELSFRDGDRLPQGRIAVRVAQLDDLRPWIGQPVQGGVTANLELAQASGRAQAKIQLDARNVGASDVRVEHLAVTGRIDEPTTHASVALQVVAQGIAGRDVTGSARLEANGPQEALKLKLSSELHHASEGDVPFDATATLDTTNRQLAIATLHARYRGQPVQLLAPARISYRDGLAADRLRIGMQQAVLEVSGRLLPSLDATASLRNATPALARTFDFDLQADGTLTMDARLTGTIHEPRGTVKVAATGVRMRKGSAARLPSANVTASAELEAQVARVDVKLSAGSQSRLEATGRVPLSASGPLELHTTGSVDAAMANPVLEVRGGRVKGRVTVDLSVSGTLDKPRIDGNLRLAEGEIQYYALGAQLTKIDASLEASGDTVRIASFSAHAGPGTISASGTVGVLAPGRPVDVKLTARNAKPLATDLLTANMDFDITLRGASEKRLDAAGTIRVNRAEINIPKALPPTVAVLDVRRPGQKPLPETVPGPVIGLDLKIDAPRAVFVRGRGLDAETGGELRVTGTSGAPQIAGGFDMRRGTFDLGAASLKFTSGKVSFTGTGLSQKIDPTLDFVAESNFNNITARLTVTGYADAPRIALTSTPELPQDEILARLLFGTSAKELSPLQLAQIAGAIATLTGVGGDSNPLMAVQKSLGLDRLSASSTPTGGTSVEAGRYVSERVYVGAKQNSQGGTQAQVQVDLTKNLKLQATLGMGGTVPVQGTTPENDPGSSIGLSYQFEY